MTIGLPLSEILRDSSYSNHSRYIALCNVLVGMYLCVQKYSKFLAEEQAACMLWMRCFAVLYLHILCISMSPEQSVDPHVSVLCVRKCCLLAQLCVHAMRQDVIVFECGRAHEFMFTMRESCDRTRENMFASRDERLLFMPMQCVTAQNASGETCMRRASASF